MQGLQDGYNGVGLLSGRERQRQGVGLERDGGSQSGL